SEGIRRPRRHPHHRGLLRAPRGGCRGGGAPHPDPADRSPGPVSRCITVPERLPADASLLADAAPERPRWRTGWGQASPKGPESIPFGSPKVASVDHTEACKAQDLEQCCVPVSLLRPAPGRALDSSPSARPPLRPACFG